MKQHQVIIDSNQCIGCGLCSKVCAAHNIEIRGGKAKTQLDDCLMCGQCSAVCPKNAISISGYDSAPSEDVYKRQEY